MDVKLCFTLPLDVAAFDTGSSGGLSQNNNVTTSSSVSGIVFGLSNTFKLKKGSYTTP
jgi:hypothetical protein